VFVLSSTECDFQKNWRITIEDVLLQLLKLKCITLFTVNGRKNRKKIQKMHPYTFARSRSLSIAWVRLGITRFYCQQFFMKFFRTSNMSIIR